MEEQVSVHRLKRYIKNIAFFGDSSISPENPVYQDAFEIAKELAGKGFTIVNGGGPGVMAASTKGAEKVGGETLAVTFYPKDAPGYEGRYLGNVVDKEIVTTNYIDRMFKLIEHADLFIIFKGGTGTISELGTAWVLAKLYYGHHKPFVLYGAFWKPVIEAIKDNLSITHEELEVFKIVERREDILPAIRSFEVSLQRHDHSKCFICQGKECAFIK